MIETTIIEQLCCNEAFSRKVLPFLKPEYFENANERAVFEAVVSYFDKFNEAPSQAALKVDLGNLRSLSETNYRECLDIVANMSANALNVDWLLVESEKFCQDRASYLAVMQILDILDDKERKGELDRGIIPQLMKDALAVSFDGSIGHDYLENAEERFAFYHNAETKIPFDLEYLNRITGGGLATKTLTVFVAGTGAGKSLIMGHLAGAHMMMGKNVLYITMEMAEERISERLDANLLNVDIENIPNMRREVYLNKVASLAVKTAGKLIVKEYPSGSAHVGHFRHLLSELKLKKNFSPDVIYIDYLNICASSRLKRSGDSSYYYVKSIAEELRGLAQEANVPIVTATQVTRSGYGSSDIDLTDTSESFGVPSTADLMLALIRTEELDALGQVLIKQLKNRYRDPGRDSRFVLGLDRPKMRFYDAEESAQDGLFKSQSTKALPSTADKVGEAQAAMRTKYPITHQFRNLEV